MDKFVRVHKVFSSSVIKVNAKELKFRASVYGLLIENGQVLIQRDPKSKLLNLPGGAIEKGETIKRALVREFKEETGLKVRLTKLRKVKEDFINFGDETSYHSILIFYEVEKVGGKLGKIQDNYESIEVKFISINKSLKSSLQEVFRDFF